MKLHQQGFKTIQAFHSHVMHRRWVPGSLRIHWPCNSLPFQTDQRKPPLWGVMLRWIAFKKRCNLCSLAVRLPRSMTSLSLSNAKGSLCDLHPPSLCGSLGPRRKARKTGASHQDGFCRVYFWCPKRGGIVRLAFQKEPTGVPSQKPEGSVYLLRMNLRLV